MEASNRFRQTLVFLGIVILQFIMTQVITLLFSFVIPGLESLLETQPAFFAAIAGFAFSTGVFLAGWLALARSWLVLPHRYGARLAGALIGAYLPLVAALIIYDPMETGNPFFFISILGSIFGFYVSVLRN